ncbi:MAG: DNA-directed RNA polymerase subunit alpha, partial [Holosporaceae bacterium]|nr:DNA-directed RNA polymerase subunit alpha [Holosporaceae bacterium]
MIQKQWQDLIKPYKLQIDGVESGSHAAAMRVATMVAEPLERGFGVTLGNSLRRVLLSSLKGAAVTSVRIDGVLHEFSAIPGVTEDVTDIILNVKSMPLKLESDTPRKMRINVTGPCEVTAGSFELGSGLEILNPSHHICTVSKDVTFSMEMSVSVGRGYVPSSQNRTENAPIGT